MFGRAAREETIEPAFERGAAQLVGIVPAEFEARPQPPAECAEQFAAGCQAADGQHRQADVGPARIFIEQGLQQIDRIGPEQRATKQPVGLDRHQQRPEHRVTLLGKGHQATRHLAHHQRPAGRHGLVEGQLPLGAATERVDLRRAHCRAVPVGQRGNPRPACRPAQRCQTPRIAGDGWPDFAGFRVSIGSPSNTCRTYFVRQAIILPPKVPDLFRRQGDYPAPALYLEADTPARAHDSGTWRNRPRLR